MVVERGRHVNCFCPRNTVFVKTKRISKAFHPLYQPVSGPSVLRNRTLVIHAGGVGDFVLTLPALEVLHSQGPLDLLGRPERLALAVAAGFAQAAFDIERVPLHMLHDGPTDRLKAFLAPYSRIISWLRLPHDAVGLLEAGGKRQVLNFAGIPPADWTQSAWQYYLHCIAAPEPWHPPRLVLPPESLAVDIAIHAGSGGRHKNWPMASFESLAAALESEGFRIGWVAGPAELDYGMPLEAKHLVQGSLVQLGGMLQQARIFVGNDSGITHLAAAVGCPAVAIFGPTDPRVWAPHGAHIMRQAAGWPAVDTMFQKVRALLR